MKVARIACWRPSGLSARDYSSGQTARAGCETVLTWDAGPTRLEIGLAVVAIAVVAELFELAAALLSLATALAVFVDGFLQIVFRLLDVTANTCHCARHRRVSPLRLITRHPASRTTWFYQRSKDFPQRHFCPRNVGEAVRPGLYTLRAGALSYP
jgi:hypothetical protein